jgi:hypothetical protein
LLAAGEFPDLVFGQIRKSELLDRLGYDFTVFASGSAEPSEVCVPPGSNELANVDRESPIHLASLRKISYSMMTSTDGIAEDPNLTRRNGQETRDHF